MILSCAGLAVALHGVGPADLKRELAEVAWHLALAISAVSFLSGVARAWRWKIALDSFSSLSFKNVCSAFMAGLFGLNVIPARVGEYLRVYVLGKSSSLSQSSILATVVFERILDGLTILTIFLVAMMTRSADESGRLGGFIRKEFLLLIPAIFFLCLGFLHDVWRRPARWAGWIGRFAPLLGSAGARLPGMMERFSKGLVIFSDLGRLARYITWSFASWLLAALYFYLNFLILDIDLGFSEAIVVLAVTVVGVMLPAAPGFVGTYHAFCKGTLVILGVDEAAALTFAVVTHALPFALNTLAGFVCVLRENVRLAELSSKPTDA